MDFYTVMATNSMWCWSSQMNLIAGLIFDWTVFERILNISSPNSCSNLFSELRFWKVNVVCSFSCFELAKWPFLNYLVYLVKNYYTFEVWYIKTNVAKKVSLAWCISDRGLLWRQLFQPVSYPDIFSYHWIRMGAQKLSPNSLEQSLLKDLRPGGEMHF